VYSPQWGHLTTGLPFIISMLTFASFQPLYLVQPAPHPGAVAMAPSYRALEPPDKPLGIRAPRRDTVAGNLPLQLTGFLLLVHLNLSIPSPQPVFGSIDIHHTGKGSSEKPAANTMLSISRKVVQRAVCGDHQGQAMYVPVVH